MFDFSNTNNWNRLWGTERIAPTAEEVEEVREQRIPAFTMPFLVNAPAVAVLITSESDPGTWIRGGLVRQKVSTGIEQGGVVDSFLNEQGMLLRKITIIKFPMVQSGYSLDFLVPFYFRQATLTVWEYVGDVSNDLEEQLANLRQLVESSLSSLTELITNNDSSLSTEVQNAITRLASSEVILNNIQDSLGTGQNGIGSNIDLISSQVSTIQDDLIDLNSVNIDTRLNNIENLVEELVGESTNSNNNTINDTDGIGLNNNGNSGELNGGLL